MRRFDIPSLKQFSAITLEKKLEFSKNDRIIKAVKKNSKYSKNSRTKLFFFFKIFKKL